MSGLIGRKLGMSRVFDEFGQNIAVTLVEAGPCSVMQIKTEKKDGYSAVQIAFEDKKEKNTSKPEMGRFKKADVSPKRFLREFQSFDDVESLKIGDELKVDVFEEGDLVEVVGWSKGKGFQGVVKRHGFRGGPKTHGQSDRLRAPGSVGQSSYPSRVFKGMKMAGRMGNERITIKKRKLVKILPEKNLLLIAGSIPGPNSGLLLIKK
ncbi:MAG: 50S ribosomal protein L3 [bacterium]